MSYRRKARFFPAVYLNVGKSGIQTTIGAPNANVNSGMNPDNQNTGNKGVGINDSRIGTKDNLNDESRNAAVPKRRTSGVEAGASRTDDAEITTSEGLNELKEILLDCYSERDKLQKEIPKAQRELSSATMLLVISYLFWIGFFLKWFRQNRRDKKRYLEELNDQLENCHIDVDIQLDPQLESTFRKISIAFEGVAGSDKIWDLTSAVSVDQQKMRSAAGASVARKEVKFNFQNIDIIKSRFKALHLQNANGGDLYLYPAFLTFIDSAEKIGLVDIRDLDLQFQGQRFLESNKVPKDAEIVDKAWAKVNKNGTPDKRFKDNYEIPICLYGKLKFQSITGLNEAYSISNYKEANTFASSIVEYQKLIK